MNVYTTGDEAIYREITLVLGEHAADFDIDAIAEQVIVSDERGFYVDEDADFWAIVQENAL